MIKRSFFSLFFCLLICGSNFAQSLESDFGIDHVIVAVPDLEKATETYSKLGFTIKPGRLHQNGLSNNHIKLKDGSSLELMTVIGEPGDKMAKAYQDFLDTKEGGIYIALKAPFELVMEKADELGLHYQVSFGDPFSYLTFENEELGNVFFINYSRSFSDPDSILTHSNNVVGIESVWIKASPLFTKLLTSLGASSGGKLKTPDTKENPVYSLNGYDFIIDETTSEDSGIMGIQFKRADILPKEWLPPSENHGVWIMLR
ncbi:MAG: VOC family protein [Balneolaceae bacterium]|nr:VOC family protein [Balneolaceae bacterium]MBO6546588.1 VOC family protein [Balneolaceae bacterium]MBO6648947.1 VOC family protein [Balneolaceae bacterium]